MSIICVTENCGRQARINDMCRTCYLHYVRYREYKKIPTRSKQELKKSPSPMKRRENDKPPVEVLLPRLEVIQDVELTPAERDDLILSYIIDVSSYAKKYRKTTTLVTILCKKNKIFAKKFGVTYAIFEPVLLQNLIRTLR